MSKFEMKDYVEVKERVQQFYAAHPDGRIVSDPPQIIVVADRVFIAVTTRVYRTPDDPTPCQASAYEPFPGRSSFTKDSEAMNAETSAIGRALAAAGIAVSKSMASANEVRNRTHDRSSSPAPQRDRSAPVEKGPVDIISERLAALPDDVRSTAKAAFLAEFGNPPGKMDPERYGEAQVFITGWETEAG